MCALEVNLGYNALRIGAGIPVRWSAALTQLKLDVTANGLRAVDIEGLVRHLVATGRSIRKLHLVTTSNEAESFEAFLPLRDRAGGMRRLTLESEWNLSINTGTMASDLVRRGSEALGRERSVVSPLVCDHPQRRGARSTTPHPFVIGRAIDRAAAGPSDLPCS